MVCGMGNIFQNPDKNVKIIAGDRIATMETQRLILKIRAITKMAPTITPVMRYPQNARN